MAALSIAAMRGYLAKSISSLNQNKINGLLAEVSLREHLRAIGYGERVSPGGWIVRSKGPGIFAKSAAVLFPEWLAVGKDYALGRDAPDPPVGLHAVCSSFHQSGITAYFCSATVAREDDTSSLTWRAVQLGLPKVGPPADFPECLSGYTTRPSRYNFLRYRTDTSGIPEGSVPEEFAKEHLRVSVGTRLLVEPSDVDGILYGQRFAYPLEIKEKTAARDRAVGEFFGLDLGPFVKLAFYAARRGMLHSIFVVREIDDPSTRRLVGWWFITFERLAQTASWVPLEGGRAMTGGRSTVVKIPKAEFLPLDAGNLAEL